MAALTAIIAGCPITLVIAGIRGGKTHVGALAMILNAIEHPCQEDEHHLVSSPTYQMSKVPVEKIFKLLYDKTIFPVCPLVRFVRSERMFILAAKDGGVTRITIRSLHEPDRIRGMKCLSAWLDEAAYISRYAWEVVLGRVADTNGPIWITTTPAGYNWVFDLYEKARLEQRNKLPVSLRSVRVIHFTSLENTFNKKQGFLRLVEGYDPRTYSQEVGARFVKGRGLIYYPFTRSVHVRPRKVDPRLPLLIGQDFNVDPMASIFFQPFKTPDGKQGLHGVHERLQPDSDTHGLVLYLNDYCARHKIPIKNVTIYPDASGKARSTSGKSDFVILRAAGYRVDAPAKNPMVKDRINTVNGLLRPLRSKHSRLFFDESCQDSIETLEKQIWKPESDPPVPDKEHGFDHMADAIGYPCWRRFPLRLMAHTPTSSRKAA